MTASIFLLTLIASLLLEGRVRPRPARPRDARVLLLRLLLPLGLWLILLVLTRRPLLAGVLVVALHLLALLVSNAKYRALREPLVAADLRLFTQALRHPRLYLPFLDPVAAGAGIIAATGAIWFAVVLEAPLFHYGDPVFYLGLAGIGVVSVGAAWLAWSARLSLEPERDVARMGLLPALFGYLLQGLGGEPPCRDPVVTSRRPALAPAATAAPHILAVQCESFVDARRLHPEIAPDLLSAYDRCVAEAIAHGPLRVPAWGAYTMRTEFSFLTGIPNAALGLRRFDPYQAYAGCDLPSLVADLSRAGYRCICLHPYPAAFFGRDRLFPGMGFHRFVDIDGFRDSPRCGAYVADTAVATKVAELLDSADRPLFLFVITMENHGPYHLERLQPAEEAALYRPGAQPPDHDLSVYLRHLRNSDRMIGLLRDQLARRHPQALLALFGDHVPSLPRFYATAGCPVADTDYFLWSPAATDGGGGPVPLAVEALGQRILDAAGLISAPQAITQALKEE